MEQEPYITLANHQGRYEQTIKKSRFILDIARIQDEGAAIDYIEVIRKQERRATHHVWAYLIGDDSRTQRYSDDGEPAGTAGVPMLEVLKNNHLHDVVAVVTRYFGGIKLGAGGLIRAYAGTVADGLTTLPLVERQQRRLVKLTVDYKHYDVLKNWLLHANIKSIQTQFDVMVTIDIAIPDRLLGQVEQALNNSTAGQGRLTVESYMDVELPVAGNIHSQTMSLK